MAYDPYPGYALTLTTTHTNIINAFTQAENQLIAQGCTNTAYIDLTFDGLKIVRRSDGTQVSTLPQHEIFILYGHLDGLFKTAMNNHLFP